MLRNGLLFLVFILLLIDTAIAAEKNSKFQGHFRSGLLSASFSGSDSTDGSFSIPNAFDVEMEFFTSTRNAFIVRTTMAMDFSESKVRYTYGGGGQRYYFANPGLPARAFERGDAVIATPKIRYYAGYEVGIAQVLVLEFGPVLSTFSTVLEVGGNTGAIYQIGKNFGIEGQLGLGYGFGFSSVTVSGLVIRTFIGGSYSF